MKQEKSEDRAVLSVSGLTIGYRKKNNEKIVASSLNATMEPGKLICLLGSNGTGKSTLMRSICRFIPTIKGEITISGKNARNLTEKEMSRLLSVVLTDRIVVPNATVEELVGYGRSPYTGLLGRLSSNDNEVVNDAITKSGMAHKKHQLVSTLSDGERQKAFIAKALAQDTPVILLDEPTAFLDLPARVEVFQLLRHIASTEGKSILLSTHDLDLALQMADQLWLLFQGGPLISGSPEDLLLENTFQKLFSHRGIEFDTRTGLFNIRHEEHHTLQVKGHGFRYVLLRRAFARKGVRLERYSNGESYIDIPADDKSIMLVHNGSVIYESLSIEAIVEASASLVESETLKPTTVETP